MAYVASLDYVFSQEIEAVMDIIHITPFAKAQSMESVPCPFEQHSLTFLRNLLEDEETPLLPVDKKEEITKIGQGINEH